MDEERINKIHIVDFDGWILVQNSKVLATCATLEEAIELRDQLTAAKEKDNDRHG